MKNNEFKRNEIGDYEVPNFKIDPVNTRWWRYTHIFFEKSESYPHFKPFLGIVKYDDDSLNKAREHKDFHEVILYATPKEPPFNFFISYHNWQLALLVKYFKEVFNIDAYEQGYMPSHNFGRIIISKDQYYKILNCINKHNLLPIRDLIVEIIAKAQDIYVEDVVWFDNADYKKRIKNIGKEINTCKQVLEKLFDNSEMFDSKKSKRVELDYINFVFKDGALRINDEFLAGDIVKQFKNHLEDDLPYKDWRKELDRYATSYNDISTKLKFREELAIALYNLFTKERIIKITEAKPTPDTVTECIADIIDLTFIPIGTNNTLPENKKRVVRNWLERNKLQEKITFYDIPPDKEKLHKYFDPDFINLAAESKRADALKYALYLSERFDLMPLFSDFAHIAQCLLEGLWVMGHQLSDERTDLEPPCPDYTALRKLTEAIKSKIKLSKISFKIEGDDTEYEFKEPLPYYLIERALAVNLKDYEEDYEIDIIKGKLIRNHKENFFKPIRENRLHLPEEMFIVRFVKSFYNYLLNENPLTENNPFPSEKYYSVIAMMLHHTYFFRHKMNPEDFIREKVKHWHNLSLTKSGTEPQ